MTVLVTGACGFIGLNVVEALLIRAKRVIAFDRRDAPDAALRCFAELPGSLLRVQGDVRDRSALEKLFLDERISWVIHAAAVTPGEARERADPRLVLSVNVEGTLEVLEAACHAGVGRFVYLSSGSVYGANGFPKGELSEAVCPLPETLYAISKFAGERISLRYRQLWQMDVLVARVGAAFGRWEYETGVRDTISAPLITMRLARRGDCAILPHEGRRDWIYGTDVAAALLALLDAPQLRHACYNIGPGTSWSLLDWCAMLKKHFPDFTYMLADESTEPNVDFHSARDRTMMSIARLVADANFTPHYQIEQALDDLLHSPAMVIIGSTASVLSGGSAVEPQRRTPNRKYRK